MRKQQPPIILILFIFLFLALLPLVYQQINAVFARPHVPTTFHNLRLPDTFPLDLFTVERYTSHRRQQELPVILDSFEGTETTEMRLPSCSITGTAGILPFPVDTINPVHTALSKFIAHVFVTRVGKPSGRTKKGAMTFDRAILAC